VGSEATEAASELRAEAERRGFVVSWASVELPEEWKDSYRRWVREGREAGLGHLARALDVRLDPRLRHGWASSVMLLAAPYSYRDPGTPEGGVRTGRVGRRFWVREPDPFFLKRLFVPDVEALLELARRLGVRARDSVDQGPLPLNLYAVASGTFWRGRNATALNPDLGGRIALACLLTDLPAPAPVRHEDRCASCRRCVAGCPTGALLGDGRVDLNRCISYWTTRHQNLLPLDQWAAIGSWLFGCDVCLDVCPWTARAERRMPRSWPGFRAEQDLAHPDLVDFLTLRGLDFARKYAATAFERAGRSRLARNALVVLANGGDPAHRGLLALATADPAPLVRATAAQALAVVGDRRRAGMLLHDPDQVVRDAARAALEKT